MAAAYVASSAVSFFNGSGTSEQIGPYTPGAAHRLLRLTIAWVAGSGATLNSVAGSANTWVQIDNVNDGATGGMATYYVKDCVAGADTVTVIWSADPGAGVLIIDEASGTDLSAPLDQHRIDAIADPATPTNADAFAGTAVTPGSNGEIVFGSIFDEGTGGFVWTKGTAFTAIGAQDSNGIGASEYVVQGTAASIAAKFSLSGNSFARAMLAMTTFKAAASGLTAAQEAGIWAAAASSGVIGRVDA